MSNELRSVLLTGGAGFIGSRLARALAQGLAEEVWVYDNLHPQVHGEAAQPPEFPVNVRFVRGDVRDRKALADCVAASAPDLMVHLAAETGTGQSVDEPVRYCEVNVTGTANLIEAVRSHGKAVRRIVLPSSRAVYGEGPYRTLDGRVIVPPPRDVMRMKAGEFDPIGPDGEALSGMAVDEKAPVAPCSIYASTKLMQEYLLCQAARDDWTAVVLRLQNVYGPGQSLRNPYTGVLSIFAQQAMEGHRLNMFEDGKITRDFVYVDDVVNALVHACLVDLPEGVVINIGSGRGVTILEIARLLLRSLGRSEDFFDITGDFRPGDIRHAVADISRARTIMQWTPTMELEKGISSLTRWVQNF